MCILPISIDCAFLQIQLICSDSPKLIILLSFSFQDECLAITFHPGNGSHQQKDSTKVLIKILFQVFTPYIFKCFECTIYTVIKFY